jgi:hypothetical protein
MNYQTEKHMTISLIAVEVSLTAALLLINFAQGQEWNTTKGLLDGHKAQEQLGGNKASGQSPIPLGQCATMVETGTVIVDLTCPNHTQTIKELLKLGYMIMLETANEMNLQPTTDTIDILKERGVDLNYRLNPP